MAKIIPALLVNDFETFKKRLAQAEKLAPLVQIDVTDGKFVPYQNFCDPKKIGKIKTRAGYEMHLMVKNPEAAIRNWAKLPAVNRAAFHIEAARAPKKIIAAARQAGLSIGVALNPSTSEQKIAPLLPLIDFVLILGVTPGRSSQSFQKQVLRKIKALRRLAPELEIEVDGGVNLENAKEILLAGATTLAAASAIWGDGQPEKNLKALQAL